jgi:hypothetical protein
MHIPQAGDEEFAGGVDHADASNGLDLLPDGGNAPVSNDNRDVDARRRTGGINDGRVLEDYLGKSARNKRSESKKPGEQTISTLFYSASD